MKPTSNQSELARKLRQKENKAEALLWGLLRAKQLCQLKFRREHPVSPYFVDFACVSKMLVIEIDGGYHDHVAEEDLNRESFLRDQGWDVLRFSDEEVEDDVESVGVAIAKHLGLDYEYEKRNKSGSGNRT